MSSTQAVAPFLTSILKNSPPADEQDSCLAALPSAHSSRQPCRNPASSIPLHITRRIIPIFVICTIPDSPTTLLSTHTKVPALPMNLLLFLRITHCRYDPSPN